MTIPLRLGHEASAEQSGPADVAEAAGARARRDGPPGLRERPTA